MRDLTHDLCSELLPAYVSGGLDEARRAEVQGHLSSCPDCSLELTAVEALAIEGHVAMTGAERDQLSRGVREAILSAPRVGWSERFGRRAAPVLGAVALVGIAAVAIVSLPGDDAADSPAATSGGADTADVETLESQAQELGAPAPKGAAAPGTAADTFEDSGAAQDAADLGGGVVGSPATNAGATTLRASIGTVVSDQDFARSGIDLGALVPARLPRDDLAYNSVAPLAESAPNDRVASLIRECSERAISNSPVSLAATSATYFPSDDVLLIGFVWVDDSTGDLYYEIRGWRDGRCDRVTPIYRRGIAK